MSPILKTNSVHLLLDFVRGDGGVCYMPTILVAPLLADGTLAQVLADYSPPQLWLSAVYPASHRATTKVKVFLDFITKRFPSETAWDQSLAGRG